MTSRIHAEWYVLLIGGASGVGKTTVATQVTGRLNAGWLMVDDLRLALMRSGVGISPADAVATFDAPGGLITVGELLTPAVEVVIENHVDERIRVVIEGDAILPSLLERASVRERATNGRIRAVFLYESDEDALMVNTRSRGRGLTAREHVRKNFEYGKWLQREAERRGLPTVPSRPWGTLAHRIIAASGLASQ